MQLIRQANVPVVGPERTFRYSPARATIGASLVLDAMLALIAVGWWTGNAIAYYCAGVMFIGLALFAKTIVARFRPTNWLVRLADDGLYLKLRSYLNDHIPETHPTAVFIAYREIRRARLIRERRELPTSERGGTTIERRVVVELELRQDAAELAAAIAAERAVKAPMAPALVGRSSTTYRHYPVQVAPPNVVRIEWGVVPAAPALLTVLAVHCDVEAVDVTTDYTRLGGLDRAAQEAKLVELAATGQTMAAIALARSLYGYDLAAARDFVHGLLGKSAA